MKIIVDKMPDEPKECIFSECTNQLRGNYACNSSEKFRRCVDEFISFVEENY